MTDAIRLVSQALREQCAVAYGERHRGEADACDEMNRIREGDWDEIILRDHLKLESSPLAERLEEPVREIETQTDIPTIQETHAAGDIFLKGFSRYYPGLDPRLCLLGTQPDGHIYITQAYGNSLIKTPTGVTKFVGDHLVWITLTLGILIGRYT